MAQPLVSVVIPLWNGQDHIPACLAALQAQTLTDHEVVVVDNASPDGAGEWVAKHHPDVVLVRNATNLGFAGGTNSGLRAARGRYLVTLNQDTVADPRFLEQLVAATTWGPRVGMVASKMRFLRDPTHLNSAGIRLQPGFFGYDVGFGEPDGAAWAEPREVFGPSGGAALYTRELLDEVGGFDEAFFCYYEDVDLAWRARLAGWRCVYNPAAVVDHLQRLRRPGEAAAQPSPQVVYWCERNRLWMVAKNAGASTVARALPRLLRIEAEAWFSALARRNALPAKARWAALQGLPRCLGERRRVQRLRKVPEAELRPWLLQGA